MTGIRVAVCHGCGAWRWPVRPTHFVEHRGREYFMYACECGHLGGAVPAAIAADRDELRLFRLLAPAVPSHATCNIRPLLEQVLADPPAEP